MLRTYVYERTYVLLKYDPRLKYPLCYDPLIMKLFFFFFVNLKKCFVTCHCVLCDSLKAALPPPFSLTSLIPWFKITRFSICPQQFSTKTLLLLFIYFWLYTFIFADKLRFSILNGKEMMWICGWFFLYFNL